MATGTLPKEDKEQLKINLQEELDKIEQKRQLTNNPNWQPQGGAHGSGMVPEHVWKEGHPDSKEETAV